MLSLERGFGSQYRAQRELRGQSGTSASGAGGSESWQSGFVLIPEQSSEPRGRGKLRAVPSAKTRTYITSTGQVLHRYARAARIQLRQQRQPGTIGNSNYNSLQITLRHTSKRLNVLAGYTYSKSQDQSSNLGEEVNPLDPALSRALSAFDLRHNFVVSYSYQIPFEHLFHASNRWTQGWEVSGITHFSRACR